MCEWFLDVLRMKSTNQLVLVLVPVPVPVPVPVLGREKNSGHASAARRGREMSKSFCTVAHSC